MIKSEILEIKKQFNHEKSTISKICGCYVDGEKSIKTKLSETFLCLPEEETFKYFEIFKKTFSGTIGKNLLNLDFPLESEFHEGTQEVLLRLRDSELKDEALIDSFYEKVIQSYDYAGNFLILLIYAVYDVPGKTKDKLDMEDASDEVYQYLLCDVCPVSLSKPGLSYNSSENVFQNRIQDWVVQAPLNGFLFPAFNDRSTDLHSVLYYSKNPEELHYEFVEQILGCNMPMTAKGQRETFVSLIQETIGDEADYEVVRNIHEKLNEMIEENESIAGPVVLNKKEVRSILEQSGIEDTRLEEFEKQYEETAGNDGVLVASNIVNTKIFEVKTPDVVVKVNPECSDLVETKLIDGRKCLVIEINDHVEVNGIIVKP